MTINYTIKFIIITFVVMPFSNRLFAQDVFDVARKGTAEELQQIYKTSPDKINAINDAGFTPLILAAYHGNTSVVKMLVSRVSNINETSSAGTALMAATVKQDKDIVELLLKHKANPNIADSNGSTALLYATIFKANDIATLLLKFNADIVHKDSRGFSAMDYAKQTKNETLINILKQYL
ncbi:ankyrin repeat domain-containing protein [Winogradskyella immobilis]|uniref:Ankyrin repeat domain-containing protein n=1 Tax=Winogradskyella immobilis TaxID=2816852 RepID=A0ABS8EK45_9FLAO|nr:ankyrin repeat domain-containing protein [Winogradskyella immobilis]MCC1483571.1 ankyrin repeat domain-containing protein [Winogradskyella immobilis]MCG0015665.1 ankyrin repeat domain-containing protein [Winogradskyella immobilis]